MATSLVAMPLTQALALTRAEVGNVISISQPSMSADAIAQAAASAGIAGSSALTTYLSGGAVSEAEFLSIDTGALSAIDAGVAQEISSYQQILTASTKGDEGTTDTPGGTDEGTKGDTGTDTGTDSGTDSGKTEDKTDKGDASDTKTDDKEATDKDSSTDGDSSSKSDTSSDKSNNKSEAKDTSSKDKSEDTSVASDPSNTPAQTTSTVARSVSVNLTTQKLIAIIGEQAREVAADNDLYASVMIAQAILESASGNSGLATAPNNNLFGIKGSYKGQSVVMRTQEDDGSGSMYDIAAGFRKYDNTRESLEDYADLLTGQMGQFYSGAHKSNTESNEDACDFLQGRYATSTTYASSLKGIIHAYDLTKYDEPLAYETVDTYEVQAVDEETGAPLYDENGIPVTEERTLTDLVTELTSHLGEDYVWGGTTCGSFDCSGLAQYCYKQALGIDIPRVSEDQSKVGESVELITDDELLERNNVSTYGLSSEDAANTLKEQLVAVDFNALHMGDLLFWAYEDGSVYHTAIYLGEGCYIQAPQQGDVVKVTSLAEYTPTFAMRVVDVQEAGIEAEEAEDAPAEEPELSEIKKAKLLAAKTIAAYKDALEGASQE